MTRTSERKPAMLPGAEIYRGDDEAADEFFGFVEIDELGAGSFGAEVTEIDPKLVGGLASTVVGRRG